MLDSPEEFLLRPGGTHTSRHGILFTLEEGGHKHAEDGSTRESLVLRYERGDLRGATPLSASGPEDYYGEGYALGDLFRLAGSPPGGGLLVVLNPRTTRPPRTESEVQPETACDEVSERQDVLSVLPAGAFLGGIEVRSGCGSCIFLPLAAPPRTTVVVGVYSLEKLYMDVRPRKELP